MFRDCKSSKKQKHQKLQVKPPHWPVKTTQQQFELSIQETVIPIKHQRGSRSASSQWDVTLYIHWWNQWAGLCWVFVSVRWRVGRHRVVFIQMSSSPPPFAPSSSFCHMTSARLSLTLFLCFVLALKAAELKRCCSKRKEKKRTWDIYSCGGVITPAAEWGVK